MKKVIIYFSVMAASCMLGSCSDLAFGDAFLEKAPGVDVTIDTIFSSKLYADRALNSAYATLRTGLTVHAMTEILNISRQETSWVGTIWTH